MDTTYYLDSEAMLRIEQSPEQECIAVDDTVLPTDPTTTQLTTQPPTQISEQSSADPHESTETSQTTQDGQTTRDVGTRGSSVLLKAATSVTVVCIAISIITTYTTITMHIA